MPARRDLTASTRLPTGRRAVLSAATSTTVAALPVFLVGATSVLIRPDLGFSVAAQGALVTGYFLASAAAALPAGRLAGVRGARWTTQAGVAAAAVALAGVAVSPGWGALLAFLIIGGAANSFAQLGSNQSVATVVSPARQGMAYGLKQAAVPVAILLAGLAVPLIAVTFGWRWAFALGATAAVAAWFVVPAEAPRPQVRRSVLGGGAVAVGPLLVLAVAGGLASGAGNCLGAFLVSTAVSQGFHPGTAGLLQAVASLLSVGLRIVNGWAADRRDGGHLRAVATQMAVGSVGLALLSVGTDWSLVVGALLAVLFGWSWPGLLAYAVVRVHPEDAAAATSITQTGVFAGGAIGPLAFGVVVQQAGYAVGWLSAATTLLAAAALIIAGRAALSRNVARR